MPAGASPKLGSGQYPTARALTGLLLHPLASPASVSSVERASGPLPRLDHGVA